jgi:hypothetical protein
VETDISNPFMLIAVNVETSFNFINRYQISVKFCVF